VLYQLSYSRFEGAYFKHIGRCVNRHFSSNWGLGVLLRVIGLKI